ncbi:MAG: hypothetical protein HYU88_02515 [Chloroflexi bacterium]|nr:hypothetical protein [Chloroflexota bacterium]MBI4506245.1 hypothetical protein [Chloroflexota bacterium]
MNLFRSEEHIRRWALFDPASEEGIISLSDALVLYSTESRRHMLDGDYLSRWGARRWPERREALARIGKAVPYWLPVK